MQGINAPVASSAGRLFDAVAALLGICFEQIEFEGQAAMQLQVLAQGAPKEDGYYDVPALFPVRWNELWQGILADLSQGISTNIIAAKFQNSLIHVLVKLAKRLAGENQVKIIVLSGGVMQNSLLLARLTDELQKYGLEVLTFEGICKQ